MKERTVVLVILDGGVDVAGNDVTKRDPRCMNASNADMNDANLCGALRTGTDLANAVLMHTNLRDASLNTRVGERVLSEAGDDQK